MKPTKEQILEKFHFDGANLINKKTGSYGSDNGEGYKYHRMKGRPYSVHRLIYFLKYECWPLQVDHKNGDRGDNSPENLRAATHAQNCMNRAVKAKSGRKGCYWNEIRQKWLVQISIEGKRKSLGYFKNLDEASAVFSEAAKKHYGEFARVI